jgi:hypothetical protein
LFGTVVASVVLVIAWYFAGAITNFFIRWWPWLTEHSTLVRQGVLLIPLVVFEFLCVRLAANAPWKKSVRQVVIASTIAGGLAVSHLVSDERIGQAADYLALGMLVAMVLPLRRSLFD